MLNCLQKKGEKNSGKYVKSILYKNTKDIHVVLMNMHTKTNSKNGALIENEIVRCIYNKYNGT